MSVLLRKIGKEHERLIVTKGNLFDADAPWRAPWRATTRFSPPLDPEQPLSSTLRRDFGCALVAAMRKSGVRRELELVSAAHPSLPDIGPFGNLPQGNSVSPDGPRHGRNGNRGFSKRSRPDRRPPAAPDQRTGSSRLIVSPMEDCLTVDSLFHGSRRGPLHDS